VLIDKLPGHSDERLGLLAEKTSRQNQLFELGGRCRRQRPSVRVAGKESWRDYVYALVRRLRRQDGRDEQLERVAIVQLGVGVGVLLCQRPNDATDLGGRLQ
jgi:hypothetical protein